MFIRGDARFSIPRANCCGVIFTSGSAVYFSARLKGTALLTVSGMSMHRVGYHVFSSIGVTSIVCGTVTVSISSGCKTSRVVYEIVSKSNMRRRPMLISALRVSPQIVLGNLRPLASCGLCIRTCYKRRLNYTSS